MVSVKLVSRVYRCHNAVSGCIRCRRHAFGDVAVNGRAGGWRGLGDGLPGSTASQPITTAQPMSASRRVSIGYGLVQGGPDQFDRVAQHGVLVGDDLEFDPRGAQRLARQPRVQQALGGVRQRVMGSRFGGSSTPVPPSASSTARLAAQQSSCPKADAGTASRRPHIDCIQGPMTAATRILEHEGGVCRDRHQRIDTRRTPCGFYQSGLRLTSPQRSG